MPTTRAIGRWCLGVLGAVLGTGALISCAKTTPSPRKPQNAGQTPPKTKSLSDLLASAKKHKGFFDVYEKDGSFYLLVEEQRLGQEFLFVGQIVRGSGGSDLFRGDHVKAGLATFNKRGERIFLVIRSAYLFAPSGSGWQRSLAETYAPTILESAKIEASGKNQKGIRVYAIAIHDWLVSDLLHLAADVQRLVGDPKGRASVDRTRSYVESAHGYRDNLNLESLLTVVPSDPPRTRWLPDRRYLPLGVRYTLARLPERPMTPREGDQRVGINVVERYDPSRPLVQTVRLLRRFHLFEGRTLTFYLDPAIPKDYEPYVIAGVDGWQRALAAAGFPSALAVKPLPPGAEPGDLRYPTIFWGTPVRSRWRGVTSTLPDPRTGEVLGVNIVLDGKDFLDEPLLRLYLVLRGMLKPGEPLPLRYVGQHLTKTTLHEVGHALGLSHNFAASQKPGRGNGDSLSSSIMDYFPVNLPPSLSSPLPPDFPFFQQDLGEADIEAIRFAYAKTDTLAGQVANGLAKKGLRYVDHDIDASILADPTVATYDLGADSLDWARRRIQLLEEMLAALPGPYPGAGGHYSELSPLVDQVLSEEARLATLVSRYLGGRQLYFDRPSDEGARPPVVGIPKERQREALKILGELLKGSRIGVGLAGLVAADRFVLRAEEGAEVSLGELRLRVQKAVIESLTSPATLLRLREAEERFGRDSTVTIAEVLALVVDSVFVAKTTGTQRELERRVVDRLCALLLSRSSGSTSTVPGDARALARRYLGELRGRLLRRGAGLEPDKTAHSLDLAERAQKVLSSQVFSNE